MRIIDSHAHLCSIKFTENDVDVIANNANVNGLKYIIDIGASYEESKDAIKNAANHKNIFAVIGIHPLESDTWNDDIEQHLIIMAQQSKVVGIGEIGLDFYYKDAPSKAQQIKVFKKQLQIAKDAKLPVSIHVRDAYEEAFQILATFPKTRGVMHCFNGTVEDMKKFISLNLFISFSGIVTFKNADRLISVVEATPLSNMLVETDSPYLAPEPIRGKANRPENISYTISKIAKIKNLSIGDIEKQTTANAEELFNLK